jgi:hypothetical protein
MSTTSDLSHSTTSLLPRARQLPDAARGQEPAGLSAYAGVHRRRDGQDWSAVTAAPTGHRGRHRRER